MLSTYLLLNVLYSIVGYYFAPLVRNPRLAMEKTTLPQFCPNASTPWTNLGNKGIRNNSCPQSFGITTFAHISTESSHQAERVGFYNFLSQYRIQIPGIVDAERWPSPTFKLSYFILSTIFIVQFPYASSRWPSPIQAPGISSYRLSYFARKKY